MSLDPLPTRHDLPPRWDGDPVTWVGWTAHRTTLLWHAKPNDLVCHQCGSVDEHMVNFGIRPPAPDATEAVERVKRTRTGKLYNVTEHRPARPVRDLVAYRCRHCRHDIVEDRRTGDVWDLEDDDYGHQGSTQTRDTLW